MQNSYDSFHPDKITNLNHAISHEFIFRLTQEYLPWLKSGIALINDEQAWWRPNQKVNSIANLMLHLEGNVRQWIIHGLGGQEDNRDRDSEFTAREGEPIADILARLEETVDEACEVVKEYDNEEKLIKRYEFRGNNITAFDAILHVIEHFAYHTGQMVWIAKMHSGEELGI